MDEDSKQDWLLHPHTEKLRKQLHEDCRLALSDLRDRAKGSHDSAVSAAFAKLEATERAYSIFCASEAAAKRVKHGGLQ